MGRMGGKIERLGNMGIEERLERVGRMGGRKWPVRIIRD